MSEPIRMDGQYQTRDGREVELWKIEGGRAFGRIYPSPHQEKWMAIDWDSYGRLATGWTNCLDLVPVPKKHKATLHVNCYQCGDLVPHMTREGADRYAGSHRIACPEVPIEFTEGEGLSPPEDKQ